MIQLNDIKSRFDEIFDEVREVVIGQEEVLRQMIIALLCDANVLLEGYPGLAKTLSVKTLATLMDMKFSRIQGTPDLMPSDITGTYIIEEIGGKRVFKFQQGPIFANIVLMDEINRATPKTQSALLEAMQEKQVTAGNKTFELDKPFFVLATQNPIEQTGSLTQDQYVLTNKGLFSGRQLYDMCTKEGHIMHARGSKVFHVEGLTTLSLTEGGNIQQTKCFPYFMDYTGDAITIRTQNNREAVVTAHHPFLVYRDGRIAWKEARFIDNNDLLISPKRLPIDPQSIELQSHQECLQNLSSKYTVIFHEDILALQEKSSHFTNFTSFSGKDFNILRVASLLSVKKLHTLLEIDKRRYWQLVRFLKKGTNNAEVKKIVAAFFKKHPPHIDEVKDYIEDCRINSLKRFKFDSDISFWIAYVLSDGSFFSPRIAAHQKDYPPPLDRFIDITTKKMGIKISSILSSTNNERTAIIDSKPLAKYLALRFGLREGKGKTRPPIPGHFTSLQGEEKREFLCTFVSLESALDNKNKKISLAQNNKDSLNVISYLLLTEGILSRTERRKTGTYCLHLRGHDYTLFLNKIGWIDNIHRSSLITEKYSQSRMIPITKHDVVGFVDLLGLNSFHTPPQHEPLANTEWRPAYLAAKKEKKMISDTLYRKMIAGFNHQLAQREALCTQEEILKDPQRLASLFGISMTDIAPHLNISHNAAWSFYTSGQGTQQEELSHIIVLELTKRLSLAKKLLVKLEGFLANDICYERITEISQRPYTGIVFGLTSPEFQNYVGGFNACGINHNTYNLPEAQSDRFLLKVKVGYPTFEEEVEIVNKYSELLRQKALRPIIKKEMILQLQDFVRKVPVANDIKHSIVELVSKTRDRKELIEFGASPRASIGLTMAAKARALLDGRDYVNKDDVKAMAYPILRHRIVLNFEAERNNFNEDDVIGYLLK